MNTAEQKSIERLTTTDLDCVALLREYILEPYMDGYKVRRPCAVKMDSAKTRVFYRVFVPIDGGVYEITWLLLRVFDKGSLGRLSRRQKINTAQIAWFKGDKRFAQALGEKLSELFGLVPGAIQVDDQD